MLSIFAGREGNAWSLLQYAVHQVYGLDGLPAIARRPRGKPYFPAAGCIHFNLSHSGSLVLCAVGDGEVGVDIEEIRPRRDNLPKAVLTNSEYEAYLREGSTWEAFYTLWTRKEAWCKYTGRGIPAHPARLSIPDTPFLHSCAGEDWRCAVCAAQQPPEPVWVSGYSADH